jgi:1-acyl-sn-glycerol-3-phosphate acyltransferase
MDEYVWHGRRPFYLAERMKLISGAARLGYNLYASVLFLAGLIIVFIVALPAAALGALRGGNIIYRICTVWADAWFALVGIRHRNLGHLPEEGGTYVFVSNHSSWLDAALVPKVFRRPLRPLAKADTARVPLFGFIYRRAAVVVDRSSPEARRRSVARLKAVLRKGVSILVFPEGTFNETPEPLGPFYDGAFRIAIETETPIKPVLLLDARGRMPYGKYFPLNPGRSRAVFLEAIPVEGLSADDVPMLREKVRERMLAALHEWHREAAA